MHILYNGIFAKNYLFFDSAVLYSKADCDRLYSNTDYSDYPYTYLSRVHTSLTSLDSLELELEFLILVHFYYN